MNRPGFPTMHTFHLAEEVGTIPLTRPRTRISPTQEDPALAVGEQIDLETQWKAETSILAQGGAVVIPEKRILEALAEVILDLGVEVATQTSHVATTRGGETVMKPTMVATGGIEELGRILEDSAARVEARDVKEIVLK